MHANMCNCCRHFALDLFKEIAQSKMKITKIIGFLFKSVVKKQISISKSFTVVWCGVFPDIVKSISSPSFNFNPWAEFTYVLEIKEILFFGGWLFFSVISFHFALKKMP